MKDTLGNQKSLAPPATWSQYKSSEREKKEQDLTKVVTAHSLLKWRHPLSLFFVQGGVEVKIALWVPRPLRIPSSEYWRVLVGMEEEVVGEDNMSPAYSYCTPCTITAILFVVQQ